jgi:hypothetical protein
LLAALGRNPDAWLGLMEVLCSRLGAQALFGQTNA